MANDPFKHVTVRLPRSLDRWLRIEAARHDVSKSQFIRFLLSNEPFAVALWGSEGQEYGRNEFLGRLASSYYAHHAENIAEGRPSQMTFTTAQFSRENKRHFGFSPSAT